MAVCLGLPWIAGSPTQTYPDRQSYFISFFHLLRFIASPLFNLRAWQFFSPSHLKSTSWSGTIYIRLHTFLHSIIVFFSQHMSNPSQPVCYSTYIMSYNPSLSLSLSLSLVTLYLELFYLNVTYLSNHSHLCPLKCHLIFFSYRPDLGSMQHTTSHNTISSLASNGTNCINIFNPLTADFHRHQYLHLCYQYVTGFKQPIQINDFITLDMPPFIPLRF